jgi:hypothetical protein
MTKGKQRARRLALYLSSIGIPPVPSAGSYKQWAAGLQARYNALEVGQRKLARQTGRRLFKESGSIAIAVASLANPVAPQPQGRQLPAARPSSPIQRGAVRLYSQALVCAHTALPLLPDAERLP